MRLQVERPKGNIGLAHLLNAAEARVFKEHGEDCRLIFHGQRGGGKTLRRRIMEALYGTAGNPLKAEGTIQEIATRVKAGKWTTLDLDALADFVLSKPTHFRAVEIDGVQYVPKTAVISGDSLGALSKIWGIAFCYGSYDPDTNPKHLREIFELLLMVNKELNFKR